ncbi:DUF4214 domain-containing protein [Sulfitobacter mediterraneus]|uniref:DUF4214 domain-containing protein n=1 Tax=Sulfitobacter mediterraneus TaxID=83219 RepID=UPI00249090A2|nr:DUF4214 domain-containing protein [Sulfitobacter mediterraneus]
MATQAQINAIAGLYVAYFDRAPDPAGLQFWIDQLDAGRDFSTISQDFANSAEAQAIYPYLNDDTDLGTISPAAFVTNIYANLFGRVPEQAGLDFWVGVLESGAVSAGDMVEAVSLGARDDPEETGFFDRSTLDNKIECALYFTEQSSAIATFPKGDQPGEFSIGSPEYLAAVGSIGSISADASSVADCKDFVDVVLREFIPNSSFTLCPVKVYVSSETEVEEFVTENVLYWGFADTDGGGTDAPGDDEPDTTGEQIAAAGIPADAFFGPGGYFQTLALQEFAELDVIDTDMDEFSIIDWSSVTDVTLSVNNSTGGEDGDNDIFDGDNDGGVISFFYPDGSSDDISLGQAYFNLLSSLVIDENGNTRFYEREVAVGLPVYIGADGEFTTTPQAGQEPVGTIDRGLITTTESGEYVVQWDTPLVLTPSENNGGTKEAGYTSEDNDFIQVGIVDLLHGAIIDGGGGYNTLEIDAKGHFAQPKALNNIQQISIENLPNVYTIDDDNGTQYPDVVDSGDTDASGDSVVAGDMDTIIDISRATDLENLTVTEGDYIGLDTLATPGGLNVVGMRNDATLTLQGAFTENLYVQTSEGNSGDGFTVILENVNADQSSPKGLHIFQNSPKLNLVSEGGANYIRNLNENEGFGINGHVVDLEISGSARLFIESDLSGILEDDTPITIDASANTGGVDLNVTGNEIVTFTGSQGDDRFSATTANDTDTAQTGVDFIEDSEITITNLLGDNYYDLAAKKLTLSDGDGDIQVQADTEGAEVTLGDGDNIVAIDTAELTLTVGNGDNTIDVDLDVPAITLLSAGKPEFEQNATIVAGDGENKICVDVNGSAEFDSAVVDITAGDGGNDIEVLGDGAELADITVNTGAGADSIKAVGSSVTINSGGGNDTIVLVGTDDDFTFDEVDTESTDTSAGSGGSAIDSGDEGRSVTENLIENAGILLNIDTGTGSADIHLGMEGETGDGVQGVLPGLATMNVIAKDGSSITGEDITLHVNTYANLVGASLSGIKSVVLDDDAGDRSDSDQANDVYDGGRAQLTLTVDQFQAIGAENFGVDGSVFDTHSFIKLIVDEDTSLDALGVDNLSRNIDLYIEIRDGAEVTMTAEQLHTKLARDGVTLAEDGNTDYGAGSVVITGGGFDFDPFNTSDTVQSVIGGTTYFGGSLSQDFLTGTSWFNVQVQSVYGGYDRPADVSAEVVLTIDSGVTPEVEGFDTWHTNLEIVGDSDVSFDGAIDLGLFQGASANLFTIDFSELLGTATGLTIGNFETVGEVRGNGNNGFDTEVFVEIAGNTLDGTNGDIGFDDDNSSSTDNDDRVLVTSGVAQYTVTVIDGPSMTTVGETATIRLNDVTQDVETFALRGNWNDTLEILDAAWGLNFELQAGGTLKSEGPTKYANVGSLDAGFKWYCAETTVDIFHSVDGDTRVIKTGDIVLDNVEMVNINVTGDAIIESISGTSSQGDALGTINIDGTSDVTVVDKIDVTDGATEVVDASDVAGVVTLGLDGLVSAAVEDDTSTPSTDESADAVLGGDFTFTGAQGGSVLTLCNIDDDSAGGVTIDGGAAGVALIIDGMVDLDESTLTNVTSVHINDGGTLRIQMTDADAIGAGNFSADDGATASLQLVGLGEQEFALANYDSDIAVSVVSIVNDPVVTLHPNTDLTGIGSLEVPEGTILNLTAAQFQQLDGIGTITGAGTVNITDLMQADIDADRNGNGDNADTDETLDLSGVTANEGTITTAEDITFDNVSDLSGFAFVFDGDNLTLTLPDTGMADGESFSGGTGNTLRFTDTTSGVLESIDASGFNVDTLLVPNTLVADRNVDRLFFGLPETVTKEIYTGIDYVDGVTQNVIIQEGTTVPGFLAFVKPEASVELEILNLTLEGGTEIAGDLLLSASTNEDGSLQSNLQELNIVSTGTAGNFVSGETENIITGDITPIGLFTVITGTADGDDYLSISNDLLNVNITGDQDFIVDGSIIFESVTALNNPISDDGIGTNDDEEATATLNVNSSASVVIGDLDTDDEDVDFLVVNNEGTGDLTVGISSLATVDAGDVITLNGSATGTDTAIVSGTRDFSGDTIEADWDFIQFNNDDDGLTTTASTVTAASGDVFITVTQAQFLAIGTAGFVANGDDTATDNDAVLNIVEFDGSVPFDATGLDADINIGTITMAPGVQTLDPSTNLTGVGKIEVPEGGTLNLTAAQYQQLVGVAGLKICVTDGSDANATQDAAITVNITGLTQADIDGGAFDLSMILTDAADDGADPIGNVTVTLAESVELSEDDVVQTSDIPGTGTLSNVEFILADGQDLGIPLFTQADGLEITGTGTTDVFLRFDDTDNDDGTSDVNYLTRLDVSGYSVTQLHALNTFVGGYNVEQILQDLESAVELVIYHDPEQLGVLNATNRVVIVETGVTVTGIDPDGGTTTADPKIALAFNDLDDTDEVLTVSITALGGTVLDGSIHVDADASVTAGAGPLYLQSFTFISEGDGVTPNLLTGGTENIITGNITPFVHEDVPGGVAVENNLLNVNLIANNDLIIEGTIFFNNRGPDEEGATLSTSGTADITIKSLDANDLASGSNGGISGLVIDHTGTGTLTITAGSDAIEANNLPVLTFTGTGDVVLDTDDTAGNDGVDGGATTSDVTSLMEINADGLSGDLSLSVVKNISSTDFAFDSGTGVTTMTLGSSLLDSTGPDTVADNLDDTSGWTFDFADAAAGSKFTFGPGVTTVDGSDLNIDMGANATLCIDQSLDLTNIDLTYSGANPIVLSDGAELFLTADQANGLTIVGENGAASTGVVHIIDLGEDPVDLSGISADIAGYVLLDRDLDDDATLEDDVTLDAATDLGSFTLGLIPNDATDLNPAGGQTIRLATEAQADGLVIDVIEGFTISGVPAAAIAPWTTAGGGGDDDSNETNSTNVAWLFDSVSGPLDTANYDPSVGRLWISNDLLNSVGGAVEQLFNTLPETIIRVDFNTVVELDILLASAAVDRVVELTSFTDIVGLTEVDDGISPEEHIATLTVDFGGEVTAGDFVIGDVVAAPDSDPLTPDFTTLTLNSRVVLSDTHYLATEDYINNNDGSATAGETVPPIAVNTIGDIEVGGTNPLIELMDVVINTFTDQSALIGGGNGTTVETNDDAGADFVLQTLTFNSAGDDVDAMLDVNGEMDVTGKGIDASDADITSVTIDTAGHSGTLTWTGGSPAFAGGDDTGDGNTETLTFVDGTGDSVVWLGHEFVEDADPITVGDQAGHIIHTDGVNPYAGIDASTLSTIDTSGHEGTVNLGVVSDIDSVDFTLNNDGGAGSVTLCLGEAIGVGGVLETPELSATGSWDFSNETSTGTLTLEMKDVVLNNGGSLELDGVDVVITGDIDMTSLNAEDLSVSGGTITVAAGGILRLTVEQVSALDFVGYEIRGEGTVVVTGESDDTDTTTVVHIGTDTDFGVLQTATVDLSAVTLAVTDGDDTLNITVNGAEDAAGVDLVVDGDRVAQTIIGSANNDVATIELAADDGVAGTVDVITRLGADSGDIGVPAETPTDNTPDDLTPEVQGDVIIRASATSLEIQVEADLGFDSVLGDSAGPTTGTTANGVHEGDVLKVAAGASLYANGVIGTSGAFTAFGADAETSNAGTAVIEIDGSFAGESVDVSAASGPNGYIIIGAADGTTGDDNAIDGSDFDDTIIDGAASGVSNDGQEDTHTGNDGADTFVFNFATTTPATMADLQTVDPVDEEIITAVAGGENDGDENLVINYAVGNTLGSLTVSDATYATFLGVAPGDLIDFTNADEVADAVADMLDAVPGLTATSDGVDEVLLSAGGEQVEITSITPGGNAGVSTTGEPAPATDAPETTTVTITGGGSSGELYSLTVELSNGTDIEATYLAVGTVTATAIAAGLAADFNAAAGGSVLATPAAGVISLVDQNADDGGFAVTVLSAATSVGAASSSSLLGAGEVNLLDADADVVTDFMTADGDLVSFGLAAGENSNYDEDAYYDTFAAAQAAADAAFAGDANLVYFLSGTNDLGDGGVTSVAGDDGGATGLLFLNVDGDTDADAVLSMVGVNESNFDEDQIV